MSDHTDHIDPFELLLRLRPARVDGPLIAGENEAAEKLLASIVNSPPPDRAAVARRRWLPIAVASVGVATVGGVAFAGWLRSEPSDPIGLSCYSELSATPAAQVEVAASADPINACRAPWRDGTFGRGPAPDLIACVNDRGLGVVLPGAGDACASVGYADFASPTGEPQRVAALADELDAALGPVCVDEAQTMAIVKDALARRNLSSWTIAKGAAFDGQRRCGAAIVDEAHKVVDVSAIVK
jgi:hypothetical protein